MITLVSNTAFSELNAVVYRGTSYDLKWLKDDTGGVISDIYDSDAGLMCKLTLEDGQSFNLVPGQALCWIPDTSNYFIISADTLTLLYTRKSVEDDKKN